MTGIGYRWDRIAWIGTCGANWLLLRDGRTTSYVVTHCGHPTALYPYYVTTPSGAIVLAPNGKGFTHLKDAQNAALRDIIQRGKP